MTETINDWDNVLGETETYLQGKTSEISESSFATITNSVIFVTSNNL